MTKTAFPAGRLPVDPERFADDDLEPMSAGGMGVIYANTHQGKPLRRALNEKERPAGSLLLSAPAKSIAGRPKRTGRKRSGAVN